jgi:hypothetical protein
MMMQGHQAMTPIRRSERVIELRESFFAESAARGTREAAVEKHDPPGTEVGETADCEWVCPKFPMHDRRIVMIARYAQHWHPKGPEHATNMCISAWVVLHQIARDEYNFRRPRRGLLRVGKRGLERGQRCYTAQCFRLAPIEVRIGELDEAQNAHDLDIACRIL